MNDAEMSNEDVQDFLELCKGLVSMISQSGLAIASLHGKSGGVIAILFAQWQMERLLRKATSPLEMVEIDNTLQKMIAGVTLAEAEAAKEQH